mmetsp:Transcript_49767/g.92731  ORF Transcript_49767/g.92731 Transcript_49767/m.92731 type:complete len:190 (+) Transcript_49767:686-1255(+)
MVPSRLLGEHLRPTALDFHVLLQLHVEDCVLHVPTEAAAEELEAMVVRPRNTCGSRVLCRFWLQLLAAALQQLRLQTSGAAQRASSMRERIRRDPPAESTLSCPLSFPHERRSARSTGGAAATAVASPCWLPPRSAEPSRPAFVGAVLVGMWAGHADVAHCHWPLSSSRAIASQDDFLPFRLRAQWPSG